MAYCSKSTHKWTFRIYYILLLGLFSTQRKLSGRFTPLFGRLTDGEAQFHKNISIFALEFRNICFSL